MHRALAVLIVSLVMGSVACGGPARAVRHPEDAPVDLARLADEIDPGALPPMTEKMPAWLRLALATVSVPDDPATLADELTRRLGALSGQGQLTDDNIAGLLGGIHGLAQLEAGRACDLACLAAAEKSYVVLDVQMLAHPEGFFADIINAAVQAIVAQGEDPTQLREVIDFVRGAIQAAPAHQRRVAARILRQAPDSPEATESLRHLARRAELDGDTARALQLRRLVATRVAPLGFDDALDVVRACVRQLRDDCARTWEVRAEALATTPEQHSSVADQRAHRARVARIVAIGTGAALEPALERAGLLIQIGAQVRAIEELEALRAAHPADARPVVGLVRASFDEIMRSRHANQLLEQARPLANHDQAFYELALGMFFTRFMGDMLPRLVADPEHAPALIGTFLPQLQADVEGLAQYTPGRAAVLALVIELAGDAIALQGVPDDQQTPKMQTLARRAQTGAKAVRQRYPDEPDAHRLALLLARFGGTAQGDYGAADQPLPTTGEARIELALMRAGLLMSLLVAWDDAARIPDLLALLATVEPTPALQARHDQLLADARALVPSLGNQPALWPKVEAGYRAQLAASPAAEDLARLHNNLGVALWHQGKQPEAAAAWQAAQDAGDKQRISRLNQLVTAPIDANTVANLADLGASADRGATRYQALRWRAVKAGLVGAELAAARVAAREGLSSEGMGPVPTGARGVILDESFNFGLGYSSTLGLVTNFALGSVAWLVLSAPPDAP